MADAKRCDRCGKFYMKLTPPMNDVGIVKTYNSYDTFIERVELCKKCAESLYDFLHNYPKEEE